MILILGGTGDAHRLASELHARGTDIIVSSAGVTRNAPKRAYPTRVRGFGGAEGLLKYLKDNQIKAVIDATHPFAEVISKSAFTAAKSANIPIIRLERSEWKPPSGANWKLVDSLTAAADALPANARAFLTVGSNSLDQFKHRNDVWFLFRGIEPVEMPFLNGEMLLQRPPFTVESEIALMREHKITHLVTKNAGGDQTSAKIDAAAKLGIPIIVVERPKLPVVETALTDSDVIRWIDAL